jgi:hypothetical protein
VGIRTAAEDRAGTQILIRHGKSLMDSTNSNTLLVAAFLLGASVASGPAPAADLGRESNVIASQLAAELAVVRQGRILFLHQSVGANVISGIERLDAENSTDRLRLGSLEEAASVQGPVLIDVRGGRNGEPKTKIDFFAAAVRSEPRLKLDLAFMKLCYVDISPRTDVDQLFGYYQRTLEALKREHPEIRFAHVTIPLTSRPSGLKWRIFRLIGKEVWEDAANAKRAEYNRRIKQVFATDPIFELAQVEATAPDGRLTTFELGGRSYLSLYSGYTGDGEHLNAAGQRVAGIAAVRFMAQGLRAAPSPR